MNRPVVIVGASAGIGRAIARALAEQGGDVLLAGRDEAELEAIAADLRIAYDVAAQAVMLDVLRFDEHERFVQRCVEHADEGVLGGIVLSQGFMSDQQEAMRDFAKARQMIDVNHTASVSLINHAVRQLAEQGEGFVCGISSVAGDRGRQSNFIYGSTKAAFSAYLNGLRNAMQGSGVHVMTVKPGMVLSAMTWGKAKPGSPVVVEPERIASDVVRALRRKRGVVYTPWFWRGIMLVIRLIPDVIFKRMKL